MRLMDRPLGVFHNSDKKELNKQHLTKVLKDFQAVTKNFHGLKQHYA